MLDNIWKAHDSSSWQNNFINGIQIHDQSLWFKPMVIYLSKTQFSLAISKAQTLALFKTQFSLATSKPNSHWQYQKPNIRWHYLMPKFHWQHQSPTLIGNIKTQFLVVISKAQLTLALLKAHANYLALFYQKPKVINTWQNTIS